MGVAFFPCDICEVVICDAGPYFYCGKCEAMICEDCIEDQIKKYKFGTREQKDSYGDDCIRECDNCSKANKPNRIRELEELLRKEKES